MVYKTLEITLISAKDLKNVNFIGKMDPYVVVHLSDEPKNKQKTPVHQDAGTNPSWNYTMRFTVDDAVAAKPGKCLMITIKHDQSFGADKDLGEVIVPLKELLDGAHNVKDGNVPQTVTYQVKRVSSGKPQGELKMSYKFIDMANNLGSYDKPVQQSNSSSSSAAPYPLPGRYGNVYPPPPQYQAGSVYPPPQTHGHEHEHGQPAAGIPYAAPPEGNPPGGYGNVYPPPPQYQAGGVYPPPKTNGHGHEHGQPAAGIPYAAPPEVYPPQSHGPHGTGVPYTAQPPAGGVAQPPHGYPPYGGYPSQPAAGYGYGYPPPGGYSSYPQAGYAQKPKKNNNFGMGLGAGLLGGAVGGLILGDVMDDAFDADYDF